jgi:hypothetical protein
VTDNERVRRMSRTLSTALDLTDAVLDRLEREGLDTTTERELLAQLWWDGAALADRTRSEEKEND